MPSMKKPERAHRAWTDIETDKLSFWWGTFSVQTIAKRLDRTPSGVCEKARKMKLGAFARGTVSMKEFERLSGFDESRIRASAEALGIKLQRIGVGNPNRPKEKRAYNITEEQQEQLLAHFTEHPGIFYPNKPGSGKSTQGVWGIGRKPPACLVCNRNDRPHYSKGMCSTCYQQVRRAKEANMFNTPIRKFTRDHHFLSNFYLADVWFEDAWYASVEHAYQAAKTTDPKKRATLQLTGDSALSQTPSYAKRWGRRVALRPDWEDIKFEVMETLLREKFTRHADLADKLLATQKRELIEENTWGDRIWGVCDGVGENHLGKLLMKIRDEIRRQREKTEHERLHDDG